MCPQDCYGSREGLLRFLKMHNEGLAKAGEVKPTRLRQSALSKSGTLRANPLTSEILDDYKKAKRRNDEKF